MTVTAGETPTIRTQLAPQERMLLLAHAMSKIANDDELEPGLEIMLTGELHESVLVIRASQVRLALPPAGIRAREPPKTTNSMAVIKIRCMDVQMPLLLSRPSYGCLISAG